MMRIQRYSGYLTLKMPIEPRHGQQGKNSNK